MGVLYADPSALARLYLRDEPDSDQLIELLLASSDSVLTSIPSTQFTSPSLSRRARHSGEPIVFVTRDGEQAIAARELGLEVG